MEISVSETVITVVIVIVNAGEPPIRKNAVFIPGFFKLVRVVMTFGVRMLISVNRLAALVARNVVSIFVFREWAVGVEFIGKTVENNVSATVTCACGLIL